MKKSIKIFAIIIAMMFTLGVSRVNAATATATLTADKTTVKPGDTVTLTLHVTCSGEIDCVGIDEVHTGGEGNANGKISRIVYDSNVFEIDENYLDTKAGFSDMAIEGSGDITLMYSGDKTDVDVCTFTFKVKETATSQTATIRTDNLAITPREGDDINIDNLSVNINIHADDKENNGGTTGGNTTDGNTTGGNTAGGNTTSGNTTSGNTTSGNTTSGNTTSGNTTSGNKTTVTNTNKSTTTATTTLPKTGIGEFVALVAIIVAIVGTVSYIGYKKNSF